MKKIHPEIKNYFKTTFWRPHWLVLFIFNYSRILYRGFIAKNSRKKEFISDYKIDKLIKLKYTLIKTHHPKLIKYNSLVAQYICEIDIKKELNLLLADGSSYKYKKDVDWLNPFSDPEMGYSLNRWGWIWHPLFTENKFYETSLIDGAVNDWLVKLESHPESDIWEPYSCAERISNYIMYNVFTGKTEIPQKITMGLKQMAVVLLRNLEFKKGHQFFNHLLNNARGLYIYARMLGDKSLEEIAKAIIIKYFDKIFSIDGFSREGSTHYQFIFTRWFIDVYIISLITEDDFADFVKPRVKKMIQSCLFFSEYDKKKHKIVIPLIGDISPDFAPDILPAFVFSPFAFDIIDDKVDFRDKTKKEIKYFFNDKYAIDRVMILRNSVSEKIEQSSDGTWTKVIKNSKTLFFHFIEQGMSSFPSHEHIDTGSFVYFIEGQEMLSDPGRLNYYNNDGMKGVSATSHNSIIIDEFEPFAHFGKNKFANAYKKTENKIEIYCDSKMNNTIVTMYLNGYNRLVGDKISITRTFILDDQQLKIQDEIEGKNNHKIKTNFNIGKEYSIVKRSTLNFLLINNTYSNTLNITVNVHNNNLFDSGIITNSLLCKQYGQKLKGEKLNFNQTGSLPSKTEYTIA